MRSFTMALDQIWKRQLALVTYGNEFLNQDLNFNRWINHSIFDQHIFLFRDLISQHLLAQHFHIWLEGLKKQGVQRLSLHNSSLLIDEKNPNVNVELLAYPHFIVSHAANKKTAWIFGKELPEWYLSEDEYQAPKAQTSTLRQETLWCYELNSKLIKQLDADFKQPNWDDIQTFMANELFNHPYALNFQSPLNSNLPYTGLNQSTDNAVDESEPSIENHVSLLPTNYQADYAHRALHNIEALSDFIQQKIQHPYSDDGTVISPNEQLNFRNFAQHIDDLHTKFITKVANHYKTAQLTPVIVKESPLEESAQSNILSLNKENKHHPEVTSGKSGVFTLICITIIICLIGYYFGL